MFPSYLLFVSVKFQTNLSYYFLFSVISLDDDEPPIKAIETRIETQNTEIRTLVKDFR